MTNQVKKTHPLRVHSNGLLGVVSPSRISFQWDGTRAKFHTRALGNMWGHRHNDGRVHPAFSRSGSRMLIVSLCEDDSLSEGSPCQNVHSTLTGTKPELIRSNNRANRIFPMSLKSIWLVTYCARVSLRVKIGCTYLKLRFKCLITMSWLFFYYYFFRVYLKSRMTQRAPINSFTFQMPTTPHPTMLVKTEAGSWKLNPDLLHIW